MHVKPKEPARYHDMTAVSGSFLSYYTLQALSSSSLDKHFQMHEDRLTFHSYNSPSHTII